MTDKELGKHAKDVAHLFMRCDTEKRGDLLNLIARELRYNAQGFTARVFSEAAGAHGMTENHYDLS